MRPSFPNCVMTPEIISHIRQEQEYYDQDPERYERQEQERQEQYWMEQEEMAHQERLGHEMHLEQKQIEDLENENDLPF